MERLIREELFQFTWKDLETNFAQKNLKKFLLRLYRAKIIT